MLLVVIPLEQGMNCVAARSEQRFSCAASAAHFLFKIACVYFSSLLYGLSKTEQKGYNYFVLRLDYRPFRGVEPTKRKVKKRRKNHEEKTKRRIIAAVMHDNVIRRGRRRGHRKVI